MTAQWQEIPIDFGGGLDTKTDPKSVVPGKMLLLENGVFTNPKRIAKDPGFDDLPLNILGGGTISNPKLFKAYGNEGLLADGSKIYSWSPTLSAWVPRNQYVSAEISESYLFEQQITNHLTAYFSDSVVLGNLAAYAWVSTSGTGYLTVNDLQNGTTLLAPTKIALKSDCSQLRLATLGSSIALFYVNASSQWAVRLLSASSGGVSLGSEIVIATSIESGNGESFDFITTNSGGVVAFGAATVSGANNQIVVKTLDTTGSVTHTATLSSTGQPFAVHLTTDSNLQVWVYWTDASTSPRPIYYAVFGPTLTTVTAKTSIGTATGSATITAISTGGFGTQQRVYYWTLLTNGTISSVKTAQLLTRTVDTSGTVSGSSQVLMDCYILSKPFTVSSTNYMWVWHRNSAYLIDLTTYAAVAKSLDGRLTGLSSLWQSPARVNTLSSRKVLFSSDATFQVGSVNGAMSVSCDFNSANSYYALTADNLAIFNGSIVTMYDGDTSCELGFHQPPVISGSVNSTTGGSLPAGTYEIVAVYQWYDSKGNIHQSAPSDPLNVTTTGTTSSIQVAIKNCNITQRSSGVSIAIYITDTNGTIPYLWTLQPNDPTSDALVYTLNDPGEVTSQQLYTSGGVLGNDAPPAAMIMAQHNDRLWLVNSETGDLYYSKSYSSGTGLSFSGFLLVEVDPRDGGTTCIQSLDDKLIGFKKTVPYVIAGDGANDAGTGSSLSNPQFIPSDAGCTQFKSAIVTAGGVLRMSDKGWYLLDRSLSDKYMGAEVEAYNSQTFTQSVPVYGKTQYRFITSSGSSLIFDYMMNQWSVRTNQNGYSADNWNGVLVYVRTDGHVYQQNAAKFLDGSTSYRLRAQTSHLSLSGIQGFQRVRRVLLLGDYTNGASASHGVQISAAYDFSSTFSTPIPYLPGGTNKSAPLQYRERLPRQKCDALCLLIEEVVTGDSAEFIDFTNLSLEVAAKRGLNKMPASASVG